MSELEKEPMELNEAEWEDEEDLDMIIQKEQTEMLQRKTHKQPCKQQRRRQYTREYKLRAIRYTQQHAISKYKVAQKFKITPTMLRKWIRDTEAISQQRVGQRRNVKGRQALLPEMELALYTAFTTLRNSGSKVKVNWFLITARKLFEKYYPQHVNMNIEGKKE